MNAPATARMTAALTTLAAGMLTASSAPLILFDAKPGTSPSAQKWPYLAQPFNGSKAVQSISANGARLDTTPAVTDKAGYFSRFPPFGHPANPALKREKGFTIRFGAALLSETHNSNDRAGLSLIVLCEDLKGIELGFWTDRIFAQSGPDFLHAEETLLDTTREGLIYELNIQGETYTLNLGDSHILSGPLRNYSPFGSPYNIANFIFVGDDTSSAAASFDWTLLTHEPLPDPAPAKLVAGGFADGAFILSIEGVPGTNQRVDYSNDTLTWTELTNLTLSALPTTIQDTNAHSANARTYRAVSR